MQRIIEHNLLCGAFNNFVNKLFVKLFVGNNDTQTRKGRKGVGLDINAVQAALEACCGCADGCNKLVKPTSVLKWRVRYHTLTQGYRKKQKLLEMYNDTLVENNINENKFHMFEGIRICR